MKRMWWLLPLALAWPASGQVVAPQQATEVRLSPDGAAAAPLAAPAAAIEVSAAVSDLDSAIANHADDAVIYQKADIFAEAMPSTKIAVKVPLHPWRVETDLKDTPADVQRLIDSLKDKVELDGDRVPPPTLMPSIGHIQSMNDAGLIGIEHLPSSVMGVYHTGPGTVGLNEYLPYIAMKVGDVMAASVLCHEAGGHAMDPNVAERGREPEYFAFKRQYDCLKQAYSSGEELSTTRLRLMEEQNQRPNFLTKMALDFVTTLDALWGTGGDKRKIKALVHQLYNSDGSPAQTSA